MTKEELFEDLKIGDVVKIYTESDEIFEGKVVDFGESGLKITLLNTNKSKRIMYGRITEYDIEDMDEAEVAAALETETVAVQLTEGENRKREEDVNEPEIIDENSHVAAEKKTFGIDRNVIFGDTDISIDLENVRKEWLSGLNSKQKNEYVRIANIIDYAKKVHEYKLDGDRVVRAIAEFKKLAVEAKTMNVFIALLYHEFNDVRTAMEYYHKGGAFDMEFQLALMYGYEENLFEKAVWAVEHNNENAAIVKWLCEYAVKNNDFAVISHVINHCSTNLSKVLLYWYIDKPEFQMIPDKEDVFANSNTIFLKNINSGNDDSHAHIEAILSKKIGLKNIKDDAAFDERDVVYKGSVSYYNKAGRTGIIRNLNGETIEFGIKQVKDIELQRILVTGDDFKRKVTYRRGVNLKGEIAADAIELDEGEVVEIPAVEYEYEGYFEDYDVELGRGKIISGNQTFNFKFNAVKDPLLYAEIMSKPYSVLDVSVKFNAKDYKSKTTKKTSKIAYDICRVKEYSKDEIDELISQRYVTKREVNEWLGIDDKKRSISFRPIAYEPLESVAVLTAKESAEKRQKGSMSARREKEYSEYIAKEKEAVAILLASADDNPFLNLKKDNSGRRYLQDALRYMTGIKDVNGQTVGIDLEKAESYFIKAIEAGEQVNSAVANLSTNVYTKMGGEYVIKGLQLLEQYGHLFPEDNLTDRRIQLIDKSGNLEALELIYQSAIPRVNKKSKTLHYMTKLAGIYFKREQWDLAVQWFNKCSEFLDANKKEFPQYDNLRKYILKSLIIAAYTGGRKNEAMEKAKSLLTILPEDSVINSIANGTFELNKSANTIEEFADDELRFEDDLFDNSNSDISLYMNARLQVVDLSNIFGKIAVVYDKLQSGRYVGNSDDLKKAIKYIYDNILKKNRGISAEIRRTYFIGIARIISDSRENPDFSNKDKISSDEVKKYIAKYARYSADVLVEKYATVDSIRFMYIQALRYLEKEDHGNIVVAINMLVASFFVDSTKLPDELHDMENSVYKDSYYKLNCVSVKDLLIATFMLQERQDYVTMILEKIYSELSLRFKVINSLNRMLGSDKSISDSYDFNAMWKQAKGIYYSNLEQLGKEISESVNEYHMAESIRMHIQRIQEILNAKLLWNQDELVIESYLKLITLIGDTFEKYTVEEKIEGFRMAEAEIAKLKGDIESSPTEFGYDYVYSKLDELRFSIRARFDDLYQSSRPECNIFLSNDSVYVNEKSAEIAITFSNADDKQDADAVEIFLEGSEGASFLRCEKKFTSVRSGEKQDYLAVFALDDKVIAEGQFEITVLMQFKYWDSVENIKTTSMREVLPVNITDKDNYVRIENKYNRIIRGSGVDVKTPELFKGRNELIDSICASMSSADGIMTKNRGIILWGQRRVGKNSVKDYLKEKIRSEYPDAYIIIELGSIGKCRNLREVLITIINKTEDSLMQDYEEIYEKLVESGMEFSGYALEKTDSYMPEFTRFMDRLSARLRKISSGEKNIPLFFLDEFSYLYEWIEKGEIDGKEFMRFWKSFIQDYGVCLIIIAQDNIPVWKSKYENEFACMNHDNEITYLDYDGAKELICEPCQVDDRILFAPEAVKLIYDWTKGSAYLIVIFCKHVIDYLNENYTEKATKTIVQLVFEKEFIERKEMFISDDFEPQIQDVANVGQEGELINFLNEELLKEIASATITSPQARIDELRFFINHGEKAEKIFTRLKERKIIEVERDTYCSISMPLLKFYLLREQSLLDKEVLNKMIR